MPLHALYRCLLSTSLALVAPSFARAQDSAAARDTAGSLVTPRSGTWGAELGIGSGQTATLLRFRSPISAMMLGAEASWVEVSEELPAVGGVRANRYTLANIAARLGFRRYRATALAVRPFSSLGLLAGYVSNPSGPGWTAGVFGELGASYFFSPHVSLGAVGGLQAIFTSTSQQFNDQALTRRQFGIRASAVQLLGAVYF